VEGSCEYDNKLCGSISVGKFLSSCISGGFSKRAQLRGVSKLLVRVCYLRHVSAHVCHVQVRLLVTIMYLAHIFHANRVDTPVCYIGESCRIWTSFGFFSCTQT
jgi:hypothetical protein